MQILVQVDKTYTLDVTPNDTIQNIKVQIEDKSAVCAKQQRLIFGVKEIKDSKTLKYYNIGHLSIINVIQSLPKQPPICLTINISMIHSVYLTEKKEPLLSISCDPYLTLQSVLKKLEIEMDFIESKCLQISVVHKYFNLETVLTKQEICNSSLLNIRHILEQRIISIQFNTFSPKTTTASPFIQQIGHSITNKSAIRCNKFELDIICQIAVIMKLRKSDDLLLYESAMCIFHFTQFRICHFSAEAECINKFILPSILQILIKNECDDDTKCVLLECIINVISHSDRFWIYEHREFCLNNDILIILRKFAKPTGNEGLLVLLSEIIYYLCNCTQIIETGTATQHYLQILELLYILMYFEDNQTVMQNSLNACSTLINISQGSRSVLDNIIRVSHDHLYSTQIKTLYLDKTRRDRVVFTGYIETQPVPHDIVWLIFKYFNCYFANSFLQIDILRRLINLFTVDHGYSMGVKNTALTTLQRITQFCSLETLDALIDKYEIWECLNGILAKTKMDYSMYEVYWICNHISYGNFESLWSSQIMKTMISRFNNEEINVSIDLVLPLFDVIMDNFNYDANSNSNNNRLSHLIVIVIEYKLIEALLHFIKSCSDSRVHTAESMSKAFDLMEFLLSNEEMVDLCIQKIKEYDGNNILKQMIEKPGCIQQTQRERATNIINTHFDAKKKTYNGNKTYNEFTDRGHIQFRRISE